MNGKRLRAEAKNQTTAFCLLTAMVVVVPPVVLVMVMVVVPAFTPVAVQQLPSVGKIVGDVEKAPTLAWKLPLPSFSCGLACALAAFAGSVIDVQNQVAQSFHREVVVFVRKLESEQADRTAKLKGEIAIVVEAQQQTRIVLARGGGDGFSRTILAHKAGIVGFAGAAKVNCRGHCHADCVLSGNIPIASGRMIDEEELLATYATGLRNGRSENHDIRSIRLNKPELSMHYETLAAKLRDIGILAPYMDDNGRTGLRISELGKLFEDEVLALFFSPKVKTALAMKAPSEQERSGVGTLTMLARAS